MVVPTEDNYTIAGFVGIADLDQAEFLTESQQYIADNVLIHRDGSLRKRWPTEQFTTLTAGTGPFPTVIFIGQYIESFGIAGETYSFLHDASVPKTYVLTGASLSPAEVTGLNGQIVWDCCQYAGAMYFACESQVFKWTTSGGAVAVTGSPNGLRRILTFRDRLFGIVHDRLSFTDVGDGTAWGVENFLDIGSGDGEQLSAMEVYGDSLILAKFSSQWMLHFSDDPINWFLRCIHPHIGCTGPRAMKIAHNLVYFMDRQGMWQTDTVTWNRLHGLKEDMSAEGRPLTYDLFVDTVSSFKDWIIYSSRTFGTRAYHREQPYGFTNLVFPDTLWSDIREQKQFFPANSRYLMSIGNACYRFVGYGAGLSVPVTIASRMYDLDRISRTKRIKYATIVTKGAFDDTVATYAWKVDEDVIPAQLLEKPVSTGVTSSCKLVGPGFGRTFGLIISETSNKELSVFAINFISQLHRQQLNEHQAS